MRKTAKKSEQSQPLHLVKSVPIEIPLPLLSALEDVENAFFGLCVEAGKQVLGVMMEQDRTALCGPENKQDPDREAFRAGTTISPITLGGRRIEIQRPRVRSVGGTELGLPSYRVAADQDPLQRHTLEAIAAGVSTRKYARTLDPLPEGEIEKSVSKSSVSRRFVALSEKKLTEWISQPLCDHDIRIVMIDGLAFRKHSVLIALGIDFEGKKHVLGLHEGASENAAVAKSLIRDLIDRGLRTDRSMLFVIDGSKALRKAIRTTLGDLGLVQRCQLHKRRNVLEHLPEFLHANAERVLLQAWDAPKPELAKRQLERFASSLEAEYPGAAASVREGLEETLTLQELGVSGALCKILRTTNVIENLNGGVSRYTRNVRRWRGGHMIIRWVGAALFEVGKGFRRVRGFRDIDALYRALDARDAQMGLHVEEKVA